jgi:dihydrofolate reductase
MSALRIQGFVIVSADGMLADVNGVMPETLKFPGDLQFFTAGLDESDLIVHGRNSYEDQPNSPQRKRIILSRATAGLAADSANPKATLWNPDGASFEQACEHAGVRSGKVAVIGGPDVFAMFLDRYDVFWLSQARGVHLPDGEPCFPGVPQRTPQQILERHGLTADEVRVLDAKHGVSVTAWRRSPETRSTQPR